MLQHLRGDDNIAEIKDESSRHKITFDEKHGFCAYYFSVPIRDGENNIVSSDFSSDGEKHCLRGTSGIITVDTAVTFEAADTRIHVTFSDAEEWYRAGRDIVCRDMKLSPTLNGVVLHKYIRRGGTTELYISAAHHTGDIRANSKYFALMKQRFVPQFSVSAIGVQSDNKFGALLLDDYTLEADGKYKLTFYSPDTDGEMCIEFNMHEQKLVQDTTVESAHPGENNAFGTTAFIGHSDTFGAQQFYLKFNYPALGDLAKTRITSVRLYMPVLGGSMPPVEALHMDNRFCSFGSTWNKRVKPSGRILPVTYQNGFCCVDLSNVMIDGAGLLRFSNGFHLRTCRDSVGYSVLATGDSHLFPPVLEVHYEEINKNNK